MITNFKIFESRSRKEVDPLGEEIWDDIFLGDIVNCIDPGKSPILKRDVDYIVTWIDPYWMNDWIKVSGSKTMWKKNRFIKKELNESKKKDVDPYDEEIKTLYRLYNELRDQYIFLRDSMRNKPEYHPQLGNAPAIVHAWRNTIDKNYYKFAKWKKKNSDVRKDLISNLEKSCKILSSVKEKIERDKLHLCYKLFSSLYLFRTMEYDKYKKSVCSLIKVCSYLNDVRNYMKKDDDENFYYETDKLGIFTYYNFCSKEKQKKNEGASFRS